MTEARMFVAARRDRLDRLVAEAVPELSRSQAHRLIEQGEVAVGGVPAERASQVVEAGVTVAVVVPTDVPAAGAADVALEVLYEDEHMLVINKQPGILVHPVSGLPASET